MGLDKYIVLINKRSPYLAQSSSKSEYRMDDIDRSVWLSQQTKWIDKSVVEKQQKRCGE